MCILSNFTQFFNYALSYVIVTIVFLGEGEMSLGEINNWMY